jgi:hypothetical protein
LCDIRDRLQRRRVEAEIRSKAPTTERHVMMRTRQIVLATLAALVVGTVALAGVAWAAEGGAPALAATTDESALCLEPVTETGNSTNTFMTTTNVFRVNYDGTGFDPFPISTAQIRIQTISGEVVDTQTINADESISFIVNASPGTYEVVVNIDPQSSEGKSYIVSVDQCRETTTAPTTKEDCKNGGYANYGFKNQGQCIKAVNHAS